MLESILQKLPDSLSNLLYISQLKGDIVNTDDKDFNKTSLKWLTVAMPLLKTSKRQGRDKTRERLERD